MPEDHAHRGDLAEFLRVKRSALSPTDVGLPAGARRRTPGLRREEVALLAGVSVSWYTWLEQGRPINASRSVLESLAATLRLDPVETAHLMALAGQPLAPAVRTSGHDLPDDLRLLLDVLEPAPTHVLDPTWRFVGANRAYERLFPAFARVPEVDRNLVWLVFTHPEMRALIVDWDTEARRVLSEFRADTASIRQDPEVRALVERLSAASAAFAAWWPLHDVAAYESREREFSHPIAGRLRFRHEQLAPSAHPDLRVVVHLPLPGDDSLDRLRYSSHHVA